MFPADKWFNAMNMKILSLMVEVSQLASHDVSHSIPLTNGKYLQLPQQSSCTTSLLTATCLPDLASVQDSYDLLQSENQKKCGFVFVVLPFLAGGGGALWMSHLKNKNENP